MTAEQLCETASEHLVAMRYLDAIDLLQQADLIATAAHDWDLVSRLYMPLQEARRQARQRAGEGQVRWHLIARSPAEVIDPETIVQDAGQGMLLVAGLGSIEPALAVRRLARERKLYLETFLAASYAIGDGVAIVIVIVPHHHVALPSPAGVRSIDQLLASIPPHSMVLTESQLPADATRGTDKTYAELMAMWERLHAPFLAAADATADLRRRIDAYRLVIEVDSACELAHQRLSHVAAELDRLVPSPSTLGEG